MKQVTFFSVSKYSIQIPPQNLDSDDEHDNSELVLAEHKENLEKIIQQLDHFENLVFENTTCSSFAQFLRDLKI